MNIHGGSDIRVPHEFLLHRDRSAHRIQPHSAAMPERVRTHMANASLTCSIATFVPDACVPEGCRPNLNRKRLGNSHVSPLGYDQGLTLVPIVYASGVLLPGAIDEGKPAAPRHRDGLHGLRPGGVSTVSLAAPP